MGNSNENEKTLEKKNDMLKLKQVTNNEKYVSEKRNLLIESSKCISPLKQSEPLSSDLRLEREKRDSLSIFFLNYVLKLY